MKRLLAVGLSTAAIGVLVSVTPALAQVAGNPGDIHTRTLYMMETQIPDQVAGGPTLAGPSFIPSFLGPVPSGCGVTQDFNGRYTSICGM